MIYWASRALMQKKKKEDSKKKTELEHDMGDIDSSRGFRAHLCTSHNFQGCYFPAGRFSVHCHFRSFLPEFQKLGTVSDYQYYNSASLCIKWAFMG